MVIRWTAILLALGNSAWAAERLTVGFRQAPPMAYKDAAGVPAGFAVAAFTEAGAPFPENVYCGDDELCVPLESGFGAWACAAEK